MILPSTTLASLLLLILTLFCWGCWANFQKIVFKWRFELFYYDFALGVAICAAAASYTFGSMNAQELTLTDNLMIAAYHKIAFAAAAGLLINLATILLVATISVAGIAFAFLLSSGVGLVVMSITDFIGNPAGSNAALLFSGLVLILGAVFLDIFAYRSYLQAQAEAAQAALTPDPRAKRPPRATRAAKAILLGVLSGIAWGFFFPVVEASRFGDNGVGPYGLAAMIAVGLCASSLVIVPFFINFPVQGEPVQIRNYFQGTKKQHFIGIFAGILWTVGLTAALIEAAAPAPARVGPALASALLYGSPIMAALWGVLAWREFKGAPQSVNMLILGTFVLFLAGLALMSLSPAYAAK